MEARLEYLKEQRRINNKALKAIKVSIKDSGDKSEFGLIRSVRQGILETAVTIYDEEICWFERTIGVNNG